jgi:hypothetical protein
MTQEEIREIISLKEYMDTRLASVYREQELLNAANQEAIRKAEENIAHRLLVLNDAKATLEKQLNETRLMLREQSETFITRGEMGIWNVEIKALTQRMNMAIGGMFAFTTIIGIGLAIWQIIGG